MEGARQMEVFRYEVYNPLEEEQTLTFESGGVVLYPSEVQVVIPPLCVLIHAVMLTLCSWNFITLPSAAEIGNAFMKGRLFTQSI